MVRAAPVLIAIVLLLQIVPVAVPAAVPAEADEDGASVVDDAGATGRAWDPWWNSNWTYRMPIDVNNSINSFALNEFQVPINLTWTNEMAADYRDIRFVQWSTTLGSYIPLPYWLYNYNSTQAHTWVNVSYVPAFGASRIYVYYGNTIATNASDPNATMVLYDNFDDNTIDNVKWITTAQNGGQIAETGGEMVGSGDADHWGANFYNKKFIPFGAYFISFSARHPTSYASPSGQLYITDRDNVTWTLDVYQTPQPLIEAIGVLNGSGNTFDCDVEVTIYGMSPTTLDRKSTVTRGTCSGAQLTRGIMTSEGGNVGTLAFDFNSESYANHPTYWDDVVIRKFVVNMPEVTFGPLEHHLHLEKFGIDPMVLKNGTMTTLYALVTNYNTIAVNVNLEVRKGDTYAGGTTIQTFSGLAGGSETSNVTFPWVATSGLHRFMLGMNTVEVANLTVRVNFPPKIAPLGQLTGIEGVPFNVTLTALDPDAEALQWNVTNTRFTVHQLTNLTANVSFLPENKDTAANVPFRVIVTDPAGETDFIDLSVRVVNVNDPPTIAIHRMMPAVEEEDYLAVFIAMDPDLNEIFTWSHSSNCTWLVFEDGLDNLTLSGMPPEPEGGRSCWANLTVTDKGGFNASYVYNITVRNLNDDPYFTTFPETTLNPLVRWEYQIGVEDHDWADVLTVRLGHTPTHMMLDEARRLLSWTPPKDFSGPADVVLMVEDGNTTISQNFTLYVYPVDFYEPLVTLIGPENGSTVDSIRPAMGWSVLDPDSTWLGYDIYLAESRSKVETFDIEALYYSWYEGTVFVPDRLVKGKTYYWTVMPIDETSTGRCLNGTWSFTVSDNAFDDTRPMSSLVSPPDKAYIFSTPVFLRWSGIDPAGMEILYDVYMSKDREAVASEDEAARIDSATGSTEREVLTLKPGTYYWTVVPFNSDQKGRCMSGIWGFVVPDDVGLNHAPTISPTPVVNATVGIEYYWRFSVDDLDGDKLTCLLVEGPGGMYLGEENRGNYYLLWLPGSLEVGDNPIVLRVSDGMFIINYEFAVNVSLPPDPNHKPDFTSTGEAKAKVGEKYVYVVKATDRNLFDDIGFSLAVAPTGMTIDADGVITWTPSESQVGKHSVSIRASDGKSENYQNFTIDVAEKPFPGGGITIAQLDPLILAAIGALVAGVILAAAFIAVSGRKKRKALEEKHRVEKAEWERARKEMAAVEKAGLAMGVEHIVAGGGVLGVVGAGAGDDSGVEAFDITDIYLIYKDGRLMAHMSTHAEERMDKDILTSMLIAIQSFVRDSFQEGLNSFEAGDKRVTLIGGEHVIMAAVIRGTEPKVLREEMADAVAKIEGMYAGVVEKWNGKMEQFQDVRMFISPIFKLCTSIKQRKKERSVSMKSGVEFYMGYVRLKVALSNELKEPISNITLHLEYDQQTLKMGHIKPDYPVSDRAIFLPDILPMEKRTVAIHFDPIICQESHIDAYAVYTDGSGNQNTVKMKTRPVDIVCPIFYTRENVNVAMLKRLLGEMGYKDSRVFGIADIESLRRVYSLAIEAVKGHDIRFVREFVEREPWEAESWFYGEVQDTEERLVIKISVNSANQYIEVFVASSNLSSMTGLLAELSSDVMGKVKGEDLHGEELKVCTDEKFTDEVKRTKMLLEKYADVEIEAAETEQK